MQSLLDTYVKINFSDVRAVYTYVECLFSGKLCVGFSGECEKYYIAKAVNARALLCIRDVKGRVSSVHLRVKS